MHPNRGILIIGSIEILIGTITVLFNILTLLNFTNTKSLNVLVFVLIAGSLSTLIGFGILKHNTTSYDLLLYFSTVIILSKILAFMDIIQFNGALETVLPAGMKRSISIVYHCLIVYYLRRKSVRDIFHPKG